ncbi:MAG: exopolysaccharide biosynthesis protein [Gammaproteobacteria bacterium]|nr:exopolysaccharide biosynthesis protein [Gammaproteobacteria bacterium]
MLGRMDDAAQDKERVTFDDMLDAAGSRSFGPLLLLPGLVTLAPLVGDIPGVPVMMGAVVVLTSVQLLLRRDHFWLPQWLLRRSVESAKLRKAVGWLRRPARFVDRLLRPRLGVLVHGAGAYLIALVSLAVALLTPAMEVVPFSANAAGLVLTAFGLALIASDGLLSLLALLIAGGTFAVLLMNLI